MVGNLEELRARGQGVIESLSAIQLETLLEVQKRLSALNGRRQRAFRVPSPDLAARFLVSDFLGTDQAKTTGSVRIDSASATPAREGGVGPDQYQKHPLLDLFGQRSEGA